MTSAGDQPIEKLLPEMRFFSELGALVHLRWTCPKCGERILADQPNAYHAGGYTHTERLDGTPCGQVYRGNLFGVAVVVHDVPLRDV